MAKNITKDAENKIDKIIKFIKKNKNFSLYKNIFNKETEFEKLPTSNKNNFIDIPIEKRTFLPADEVLTYSVTSGTTNKRKLFIVPFSNPSESLYQLKLDKISSKKIGFSKIMILTHPMHGMVRHLVLSKNKMPTYVIGKIDNFDLCAQTIKEANIDGLITTPTILENFIDIAQKYNILKQIKWVIMAGEHCTDYTKKYFSEKIPNALIDFAYGSTETGIMGLRCEHIKHKSPNIFHPTKEVLIETLKENNTQSKLGEEGKIVITSLDKTAFPLIRYEVGDLGILRKKTCKCGNDYTIEVLGRSDFDSIKIKGAIIHTKAIENALYNFSDFIESSIFRLDVYNKSKEDSFCPRIILSIKPKGKFLPENMSEKVSKKLWLSPKNTLYDLVQKKVFSPLEIELIKENLEEGKKRYIYYHR